MTEEEQLEVAMMKAYLEAEERRHNDRNGHPYDGVLGLLPDWFPEMAQVEFLRIRNKLLDHNWGHDAARPEQVKEWIETYRTAGEDDGRCGYWPPEFHEEVGRLAQLYAAYLRGPDEGMKFLLGDGLAAVMRTGHQQQTFRKLAGQARAEKYGPVRQMVERLRPKDLNDLLRQLKAVEGDDWGLPAIREFVVQQVDDDGETVSYQWNGIDREPVTFKTLQNHIAKLKP